MKENYTTLLNEKMKNAANKRINCLAKTRTRCKEWEKRRDQVNLRSAKEVSFMMFSLTLLLTNFMSLNKKKTDNIHYKVERATTNRLVHLSARSERLRERFSMSNQVKRRRELVHVRPLVHGDSLLAQLPTSTVTRPPTRGGVAFSVSLDNRSVKTRYQHQESLGRIHTEVHKVFFHIVGH